MAGKKTSEKKGLGFFNSLILAINIIFITALTCSYLSVHISPEKSWILPFFGLLYPFLIIINIFFTIYWILRLRWLFLIPAIFIFAGWNHLERLVQYSSHRTPPAGSHPFKIISYNVKNLSNNNVDLIEPQIRNKIIDFLDGENADILCLQEFAIIHPDPEAFIDSLSDRLEMPYHAYIQYLENPRRKIDAIFTFSKYRILNSGSVKQDDQFNFAQFTDLLMDNDTVRLFNIHLESVRLKHEDYNFISELDLQLQENEDIKAGSQRIFEKLKTAFARRASQVDDLSSSIIQSPYHVILCGDFNDTPNSYAYQKLTANLKDAFMESGRGFGNTYIGNLPSYRIDYILYDTYFTSWDCSRQLIKLSDHYPVICIMGKRQGF
jgi:endonuclease/exonuclease/phosphatase family metal-dependent hydrolase